MDPNQLILNQEDESLSYTVRIAGEQIILVIFFFSYDYLKFLIIKK